MRTKSELVVPLRLVTQTGLTPASAGVRTAAPERAAQAGPGAERDLSVLEPLAGLEEAAVAGSGGVAAGLGLWLARLSLKGVSQRLVAVVSPRAWLSERGRLFARGALRFGVPPERLLVVRTRTEADALWALEEILRAGAADLAIGAVEGASLTQTRRLDMAAREAGSAAGLIRVGSGEGLSAARRRWRVTALPSAADPWDPRAPGSPRWRAELVRRRDGPPGCWEVEWNHETHRLHLAEGLAGDGLGQTARQVAAAG